MTTAHGASASGGAGGAAGALDRIAELQREAAAAIAGAGDPKQLEELRLHYLGRKSELPMLLRTVGQLDPTQRGAVGSAANQARKQLETLIGSRAEELSAGRFDGPSDAVDISLPGSPPAPTGHLHLITQTRRDIEDVFLGLGFSIAEGPEIEQVEYNFDALNTDLTHPSRARTDTFYVDDETVLRVHTSPVQVRAMIAQPPPLYVIAPGRVYRPDNDATHTPQFHQIEGLAVDDGVTLADLKGTLLAFARQIFGEEREVLLRPHFFPFTEPSVEVDVSCFNCASGYLRDGSRCPLCKGSGWLEVLGAGMVDPNVFAYVKDYGYDPESVTGFAFGMGIERIAMLRHGVPDLRLYFEGDLRFLSQFGAR
ncbi:MAG TPA: phenylalanine--tRNA ligase subunit alpha [Solirubrobacteraceae bacterium]|nr:phenylalanine--tRNA ligase subunit alpha [Solirubrobacteraceae bacterium]